MRISLIVEADYNDLHDKQALNVGNLSETLKAIAYSVEGDYRNHNSEQNKYGIFYQTYKVDVGAAPSRQRGDSVAQEIVNQMELNLTTDSTQC